jgi:hypothetical protein
MRAQDFEGLPVVNKAKGKFPDRPTTAAGFSILLALVSVALVPPIGRARPGIAAAALVLGSIVHYYAARS